MLAEDVGEADDKGEDTMEEVVGSDMNVVKAKKTSKDPCYS